MVVLLGYSWSCRHFCMMILYGDFTWWFLYSNVGWKNFLSIFFSSKHMHLFPPTSHKITISKSPYQNHHVKITVKISYNIKSPYQNHHIKTISYKVGWKISFLFFPSNYIHCNSWIHLFPPTSHKTTISKSSYQNHVQSYSINTKIMRILVIFNNPYGGFVGWSSWFCMVIFI